MKFKVEISVLFLAIICLSFGCNSEKSNPGHNTISITLFESYNAIEIIPLFDKINQELYSLQGDSSEEISSGNKLMDQVKKQSLSEEEYFKRNPLYKILNLPVYTDDSGNSYIDTSSIIGYIESKDTALFTSYLRKPFSQSILPENCSTKFYDLDKIVKILKVHFVKSKVDPIIFPLNGVKSIVIGVDDILGLIGGITEKIFSNETEDRYSLLLELDSNLLNNFKSETYTVQFTINDKLYTGSFVEGISSSFIRLGHINKETVEILKSEFGNKVIEE